MVRATVTGCCGGCSYIWAAVNRFALAIEAVLMLETARTGGDAGSL